MDYGYNDRRKTKNDKRAKSRYNKYKKGGSLRVQNKDRDKNC
ncbi:MAG: hypothetical protein WC867_06890 [Candidatus Pacearchaeota archaeon]